MTGMSLPHLFPWRLNPASVAVTFRTFFQLEYVRLVGIELTTDGLGEARPSAL
jgi:hypothetical protein